MSEVVFKIGSHHKNFRRKIEKQLIKLNKKKIKYTILEKQDVLLPKVVFQGKNVDGLSEIKQFIDDITGI